LAQDRKKIESLTAISLIHTLGTYSHLFSNFPHLFKLQNSKVKAFQSILLHRLEAQQNFSYVTTKKLLELPTRKLRQVTSRAAKKDTSKVKTSRLETDIRSALQQYFGSSYSLDKKAIQILRFAYNNIMGEKKGVTDLTGVFKKKRNNSTRKTKMVLSNDNSADAGMEELELVEPPPKKSFKAIKTNTNVPSPSILPIEIIQVQLQDLGKLLLKATGPSLVEALQYFSDLDTYDVQMGTAKFLEVILCGH
jgi:hypothetical protein